LIRVLIADDHAVVRQGLRTFLELQDDMEVVADVADGEAAVQAARDHAPDVVVMDLVMPHMDGVEATRRIVAERPATRVVALTSFLDDDKVLPAMRAGAAGYLLKDVGPPDLVRAIRTVHDGQALLHPAVAARLLEEVAQTAPRPPAAAPPAREPSPTPPDTSPAGASLTPREREVLALLARGLANKAIAHELGIAEKTAKIHVSRILHKLGVADRTQAALHAVREGLM
jgi:NarL family two-component system response regulator LiaR